MDEGDAMLLQPSDVGFAASAHEIVHGHHVMPSLAKV
jgi:hypothetical protein